MFNSCCISLNVIFVCIYKQRGGSKLFSVVINSLSTYPGGKHFKNLPVSYPVAPWQPLSLTMLCRAAQSW